MKRQRVVRPHHSNIPSGLHTLPTTNHTALSEKFFSDDKPLALSHNNTSSVSVYKMQ